MKRFIAILAALTMAMSLGVTAMAAESYTDASTASFKVKYTATNDGEQPEEVFTFSEFTCESVTDAAEGVTKDNAPKPEKIADITLNSTTTEANAVINLPAYTSVGVYTYSFKQNVGTTSGVKYYKDDAEQTMKLVVTVVQDGTQKRVAAIHVENGSTSADKTGVITNTYENGSLEIKKTVTGNMGDKTKYFDVTVTFAPANGETIKSAITYTGGQYAQAVAVTNNTATIQVKDGDTVTFANIPATVTWTVNEADYTREGYDAATYSTQTKAATAGTKDTCEITNNKDITVDTGISLDSLPYILVLAAAVIAGVVMFVRKRNTVD